MMLVGAIKGYCCVRKIIRKKEKKGKSKRKVAKIDQNVGGVLYPKGPTGYHYDGATYEYFVNVFSKSMCKNPEEAAVESALRIVF